MSVPQHKRVEIMRRLVQRCPLIEEYRIRLEKEVAAMHGMQQSFKIGQAVKPYYPANAPDWLYDWPRHETLYIAGVRYDATHDRIDYTVSQSWPPTGNGDLTDGWLEGYLDAA